MSKSWWNLGQLACEWNKYWLPVSRPFLLCIWAYSGKWELICLSGSQESSTRPLIPTSPVVSRKSVAPGFPSGWRFSSLLLLEMEFYIARFHLAIQVHSDFTIGCIFLDTSISDFLFIYYLSNNNLLICQCLLYKKENQN